MFPEVKDQTYKLEAYSRPDEFTSPFEMTHDEQKWVTHPFRPPFRLPEYYYIDRHRSPYVVGNTILLRLEDQQEISATITKSFEPFTLSCAMVVLLDSPALGLEGHMVLKLFDRRFAAQLRRDYEIDPWSMDTEQQYYRFIADGSASNFITRLNSDNALIDEEGQTWNVSQDEAYLHHQMQTLYSTEAEVYDTMKHIQGKDIPRLYARLAVPSPFSSNETSVDKYLDIPGVLLQYIDGFLLTNIATYTPRDTWQFLCDDAIRIINLIGDQGIRNQDVNTRSFIVQRKPGERFKVFMIDFALCSFRREYRDETDWRQWKAREDEEGAVGFVMQKYLKGGFVYNRSGSYEKLDWDFKRGE